MPKLSRRQALLAAGAAAVVVPAAAKPALGDGFVRIGGIEQWIGVQGRNPHAPVLLYLHGGPGEAMSPFRDLFVPYENDFTIALWDQRGSGRTYGRGGRDQTPGMDEDQFVRDGIEVAQVLRRRFRQRKIVLVGQSWGSFLAERIAKARPDLFHAVVGTGQVADRKASIEAQERYARKVMTEKGDQDGIKALDELTKLPLTDDKRRFATRKYLIGPEDQKFLAREDKFMGPKPWPKAGKVADWIGGYLYTSNKLVPKLLARPDPTEILGYDFQIPIFVIQGQADLICPTEAARDYAARISAPITAFDQIDGGHFACLTNPQGFLNILKRRVIPLCGRTQARL